jgi:hypothetical protein
MSNSITPLDTPKSSRWIGWVIVVVYLLIGLLVIPAIIIVPVVGLVYLAAGWFWFLERVGPQIRISPAGIALGVGALLALIAGAQLAIRSFAPRTAWPLRRTVSVTVGALAMCLAGICLVGLSHELSWWGRSKEPWMIYTYGRHMQAARRTQSKNNLKQIGLAIHNYQRAFTKLPPGSVFEKDGTARNGWMAFILPYVDHAPLFNTINFHVPWYDPANRKVYETRIIGYLNPGVSNKVLQPIDGYAPAHYAGNAQILQINRSFSFVDIKDGTSNTIFAGEVKENIRPWGDVVNWRFAEHGINKSPDGFGSPFKGGAPFIFCDGGVKFISENIDPEVLKALGTPAAGDKAGEY